MALCRWNRYRALVLVLGMTAIAALGAVTVLADPFTGAVASPEGNAEAPFREGALLILADASRPGDGKQWPLWSASMAPEMVRPPSEKRGTNVAGGLTSAAIIRPLKDKKFALALVAGTPGPNQSLTLGARRSVFKNSLSNILMPSRNQAIQWLVLADTVSTVKDGKVREAIQVGNAEVAHNEGSWHYSVEAVFLPVASLAVRAALSVEPGEEAFNTDELTRALERSRIGVSIGLDFRPKDGVVLDIDYARVMNVGDADRNPWVAPTSDPGKAEGSAAGDDVISVSLSIQF